MLPLLAHSEGKPGREGAMIFKTKRVEIEYRRGGLFYVRAPLIGEVLWTHVEGWQYFAPAKA
jgi:hypothetical protein